jgi:hypothetical protein
MDDRKEGNIDDRKDLISSQLPIPHNYFSKQKKKHYNIKNIKEEVNENNFNLFGKAKEAFQHPQQSENLLDQPILGSAKDPIELFAFVYKIKAYPIRRNGK